MKPSIEQIREVRARTGLGLNEVVRAFNSVSTLDEVYGALQQRGVAIAEGKQERNAGVSRLHSYVHAGKYGAMVQFRCETDFVAKSDEYKQFMQDICLHVAATPLPYGARETVGWGELFVTQPYVRDASKTVADVVAEISARTGEKIEIGSVCRYTA
jgi:elongation factor Ts